MSIREPELEGEPPAFSGDLPPLPLAGGPWGGRSRNGPPIYREHRYATWVVLFVVIGVVAPTTYHGLSDQLLLNVWMAYAIAGVGFYWVFGLAGRFAFCQTFMMAMGGYTAAYVTAHLGASWYLLGLLAAMLVGGVIAAVVGTILSRAQDFYFAIGTLAVAEVGTVVLTHTTAFSGPSGNTVGIAPPNLFGWSLTSYLQMFWLSFGALALVVLVGILMERSPVRRHAIAGRENAAVARSGGVRVARTQIMLFAFGSMLGGLSGALLGSVNGTVDVGSYGTSLAIGIFLMLFIGGVDSIWGPIVGAAFYVIIPQVLSNLAQYQNIVYGGLLLVVIIIFPLGIVGSLRKLVARVTRRPSGPQGPTLLQRLSSLIPTQVRDRVEAGGGTGEGAGKTGGSRPMLLQADEISVSFGGVRAVSDVSLAFDVDELVGLIGPNGSGKTTFLNALTGVVPARGRLTVEDQPVGLGSPARSYGAGLLRVFQAPQMFPSFTVLENVLVSSRDHAGAGFTGCWLARPRMWRHERARWERAHQALARVGLVGVADERAVDLSYGNQRLIELARAIAAEPKVLMLDEPSAGLNDAETDGLAELIGSLRRDGLGIILVDHKIDFIDHLCDRVVVLELGEKIAEGTPAEVWADERVMDAYLGRVEDA